MLKTFSVKKQVIVLFSATILIALFYSPIITAIAANTITLNGSSTTKYTTTVPDGTIIDATQWTNTAVSPSGGGKGVEVYGKGTGGGVSNIVWRGGIIKGSIPASWDWTTTHNFGGAGITIYNNGPAEWQYIRVHNVEDGMKSREVPEYSNTASFLVRDCYMTAIRDDSIEDDRFEPGTVQDCLFDGTYTFISEQNENVGSKNPIGSGEPATINLKRVYVRSYPTNKTPDSTSNRFIGPWFKWQGRGAPNHKLVIEDSVFALGQSSPDMKWSNFESPPQVSWVGNNNYILWLGAPGGFKAVKPGGVNFLEGKPAQDKWIAVRNKWLTDHCLPAQSFPADYDPHTAPIQQIPASGCNTTAPTIQPITQAPLPTVQITAVPTPSYITPTLYCLGSCPTSAPLASPTLFNQPTPTPMISPTLLLMPSKITIPTIIHTTPSPSKLNPPSSSNPLWQLIQELLRLIQRLLELIRI